jgi:hypothetical protein
MRAGLTNRQKEPQMPKSECFFVWRTTWNGVPRAVVTPNAAASRQWLEISIEETDPFQAPDETCRVLPPYRVQSAARPACSNRWVSQ